MREVKLLGALVLGLGLLLRLALVVGSQRIDPVSDARLYLDLARTIQSDHEPLRGDRPLLYPALLAATVRDERWPALAWQVALSTASAVLLGLLAHRLWGRRAALAVFALASLSLTIAQYASLYLTESAFLFCVGLALLLATEAAGAGRRTVMARTLGAALSLVVATALRPAGFLLLLGLALALSFSRRRAQAALLVATFLLAYPALVHSLETRTRITTGLFPTSGLNLYLGNAPSARWDGGGLAELPPELAGISDPLDRGRAARGQAIDYIRSHPVETATRIGARALRLLGVNPGHGEFEHLRAMGWPAPLAAGILGVEWIAVVLLAAIGLATPWAKVAGHSIGRGLLLLSAPYVAALLVTYVQTRYRLPLFALLLLPAGCGLVRWLDSLRDQSPLTNDLPTRRAVAIALTALVAGIAFDLITHRAS